jgi:hypothetical protein
MNKVILTNETIQPEPTKNLVLSNSLKEDSKLKDQKNNDSLLESWPKGKTILKHLVENPPYPDFRYFCPSCSSLDVCIRVNEKTGKISVDCLECKKLWIDEKFVKTEVFKLCPC